VTPEEVSCESQAGGLLSVAVRKARDAEHGIAAELLGDWRSAERDTVAAKSALAVARLALKAAYSAEAAVRDAEEAVQASMGAAIRARDAADRAKKAASQAAEAAQLAAITAKGDLVRAKQAVGQSEADEAKARGRFGKAQKKGFAKGSD
jgi:hypothetical protein